MLSFDAIDLTIAGLRAHYRQGDFTPGDLLELLEERADRFSDRNIWIHRLSRAELAPYLDALARLAPADAPLYGVPFAIKDNIDLAGVPTTAACAAFSYTPDQHAPVVAALIAAGAIPLGKTNLDQFATGLVGMRSPEPWGACRNSFDPEYISGGSSSGSAVAVALGLASFALGTDTAGSGRIPAAFNNIVGLKPSRGLLSTRGMVPACRSLDCMSLFASTAQDLNELFALAARFDTEDAFARHNPAHNRGNSFGELPAKPFIFGVPQADQLQFFGDRHYPEAFVQSIAALTAMGGTTREIDFSPFLAAARLLYDGPWVAERYLAIQSLLAENPEALLPVTASIIGSGQDKSAADTFAAMYELQRLRRAVEPGLDAVDFILTPTAGTHFTRQQLMDEPVRHNSELGYYTNFMNLLDLAAIAVPAALLPNGLPFGVTLFADRYTDLRLLSYANQLQKALQLPLGAVGKEPKFSPSSTRQDLATVEIAVCGAHMRGLPFNTQLTVRNGSFVAATQTASCYRFYALPGGSVARPGLIRDEHDGVAIEVEIWRLPIEEFGSLVATIPQPLGIGKVELDDGRWVPGFLCESYAVSNAEDISALGGWRSYLKR
jgi:allophanate hydrolase